MSSSGGFFPSSILSPPSSVASSAATHALPSPRSKPLKLGGTKESAVIRYVDGEMQRIGRRFAKRGRGRPVAVDVEGGYRSFAEAARDIEGLVEVIWVSGTPSLQIPYLLSVALLTVDCLSGFPGALHSPASSRSAFRLLHKLDLAFASLLQGRDYETGETLPGFDTGRKVSDTEKVRLKSLVERTRVEVVNGLGAAEDTEAVQELEETTEEETDPDDFNAGETTEEEGLDRRKDGLDVDGMDLDTDDEDWEMEVAKVYDRTVVELGDVIGGTPIGIITDN